MTGPEMAVIFDVLFGLAAVVVVINVIVKYANKKGVKIGQQKTLIAIISAILSFVCTMLESESTTKNSGGGETTSAPSAPAPAVANWSGTEQLGTSSSDAGCGIVTDPSGNVYVTCYTSKGIVLEGFG